MVDLTEEKILFSALWLYRGLTYKMLTTVVLKFSHVVNIFWSCFVYLCSMYVVCTPEVSVLYTCSLLHYTHLFTSVFNVMWNYYRIHRVYLLTRAFQIIEFKNSLAPPIFGRLDPILTREGADYVHQSTTGTHKIFVFRRVCSYLEWILRF